MSRTGEPRDREPLPIRLAESGVVPEPVLRWGIRRLVGNRLRDLRARWDERSLERLADELESGPMAPAPGAANRQHYARPPAFFRRVLGPRVKYSAAFWTEEVRTLGDAEAEALRLVCDRAGLEDGDRVLDLGCGWGALTLWVASRYPACQVVALTNSPQQARHVRREARREGVDGRVRVVESDVADARPAPRSFDRVISVEMFEHLRGHGRLLSRIARWLRPGGRLFVHVFSHRRYGYVFTGERAGEWMGRHFFTGGLMPSHDLLPRFDRDMTVEREWRMSGMHYAKTAEAWKRNLDAGREEAAGIFAESGEPEPRLQVRRWRLFFLAVAELFAYGGGREWGISHYRFRPRSGAGGAAARETPDGGSRGRASWESHPNGGVDP